MTAEPTEVVLVDDDPLARMLWRTALERDGRLAVTAEVSALADLAGLAAGATAQLAVVDGGLLVDRQAAARVLRAALPTAVLVAVCCDVLDEAPLPAPGFEPTWHPLGRDLSPLELPCRLVAIYEASQKAGGQVIREEFAAAASAPSACRRFVTEGCRGLVDEEVVETAVLLVSELVTNAVAYTHQPFEVEARVGGDVLAVSVSDRDRTVPHRLDPSLDDPTGRGLELVERLARSWTCTRTAAGKRISFDLPTR